jgi:LysR family transcriptional regulator, hydrogen peroxide-inducible genes activator
MEMHQIRYFLAVAETLNFTRAAERSNVTQPALTRAIQGLEEELGGLLFRRERNQTHLTDLGRLMQPHLRDVYGEAEAARTTAKQFLKLVDAPISLGVMCTIGPLRFVGFLAEFRQKHPGIELSLLESTPAKLVELLGDGKIDVAVLAQPGQLPERFDATPLYRERFAVAFPPGHRFARKNAVRFADMDGENYLLRINCEYRDELGATCRAQGSQLKAGYRSEREDWIQIMVMAGMGVCFTPEYSPVLEGLKTRPMTDPEVFREISLVTVAGRRFSPAVATFVRAVKEYKWPSH